MVFGGKRIEELESENANLRQWVEYLKGTEAVQLSKVVADSRAEAASLAQQVASAQADLAAARSRIVETDDLALLQEVGIYRYRHPLQDAVAYQTQLKQAQDTLKTMVKNNTAVHAMQGWTVNGSTKEGAKMTRDLTKLMLRAYNAEADNVVRTLRPHTLASAIARLDKARETIAKLGTIVQLRITDDYHRWRVYELELTADYLVKVEEEKERQREERARQREEEQAQRELEAERQRLLREQSQIQSALEKLRAKGDEAGVTDLEARILAVESAITGIEEREANIRTGHVYVISNFGSFGERIVKIGMTRRLEPRDRIRELGDASVPFGFDVHALVFSEDAISLESKLHEHFADRRVNQVNLRREYFYATPHEVRDALEKMEREHLLEFTETPEATEWRASGGIDRARSFAEGPQ